MALSEDINSSTGSGFLYFQSGTSPVKRQHKASLPQHWDNISQAPLSFIRSKPEAVLLQQMVPLGHTRFMFPQNTSCTSLIHVSVFRLMRCSELHHDTSALQSHKTRIRMCKSFSVNTNITLS